MEAAKLIARRIEPLLAAFSKEDLEILVELTVLVAYADATIDETELGTIGVALEAMFHSRLAPFVVHTLVGSSVDSIRAIGGDAYATQLGHELANRNVGEDGYRLATTIALSSHAISTEERYRLTTLGEAAGLSAAAMEAIEKDVATALATPS